MSDCLFCRIVSGEIPATLVGESEHTVAFRDIAPQAPTHVLVVPKDHYPDVAALSAQPALLAELVEQANAVATDEGLAGRGYRLVFNTGPDAGQTVFHAHGHVLGGRELGRLA
jgi:histidine triad (HIT) family protein